MTFGQLAIEALFIVEEEGHSMRGLLGYVFRKKTAASAIRESLLPDAPADLATGIGHEIFFQADFHVVPHHEAA